MKKPDGCNSEYGYYAVLLHARSLILRPADGGEQKAGAYCWRIVKASEEQSAEVLAGEELLRDEGLRAEIGNKDGEGISVTAEEISYLGKSLDPEFKNSALVFYLETEEVVLPVTLPIEIV